MCSNGCNNGNRMRKKAASDEADASKDGGGLIKVGIINNDPAESDIVRQMTKI